MIRSSRTLMRMHVSELPDKTQDYLKTVFSLQEWAGGTATLGNIAERMGQRASTTSEAIKRLAEKGLLKHEPYSGVELTASGKKMAVQMVRRHRLIETYLFRELGYAMEELHDEAEVLEHAVSDLFLERISKVMGHPSRDPHGDPIPDKDGNFRVPSVFSLTEVGAGQQCVIDRISDRDPELLRYLEKKGALPGARIEVQERPYPELAELRILGEDSSATAGESVSLQLPVSSLGAVLCHEVGHG